MSYKDEKMMLDIAELAAERSSGIRLKVGATVTDKDGNLVAFGYNGSIRGGDNNLEHRVYAYQDSNNLRYGEANPYKYPYIDDNRPYRLVTKDSTIHAEQNCIAHAARRGISIDNGKMYITHSPCVKCASMMVQCGIVEAIFKDKHESFDAVEKEVGKYLKLTQWGV